jgi:hypothetical protein
MARHVLFTGNLAGGDSEVNREILEGKTTSESLGQKNREAGLSSGLSDTFYKISPATSPGHRQHTHKLTDPLSWTSHQFWGHGANLGQVSWAEGPACSHESKPMALDVHMYKTFMESLL